MFKKKYIRPVTEQASSTTMLKAFKFSNEPKKTTIQTLRKVFYFMSQS